VSFHTVTMEAVSIAAARDLIRISPLVVATGAWPDGSRDVPGSPIDVWEAVVVADTSLTDDQVAVALYLSSDLGTGTAATAASWDGAAVFPGTAVTDLSVATTKSPSVPLWRMSGSLPGGIVFTTDEPITVLPGQNIVLRLITAPIGATDITAYVLFENHF